MTEPTTPKHFGKRKPVTRKVKRKLRLPAQPKHHGIVLIPDNNNDDDQPSADGTGLKFINFLTIIAMLALCATLVQSL